MQLLPDHRFYVLIVLGVFYTGVTDAACDPKTAEIQGGKYKILENGTVLQYECPEGKYPYPVEYRFCDPNIQWKPMRNALNNVISKAVCKDVQCARPLEFENGIYEPRQRFYNVSQILTFTCYQGYTMRGSANRTCLPNGKWSGETTICDDGAGHCRNPGVPIGARKDGSQYRIEDQVRYSCDRGLTLMGSKERVCLESKEWSGSEPECRNPFTYDTPEEVSSKFIASLTEVVEAASSDKEVSATEKRKIKIEAGGSMNIYIVLDASRSIDKDTFSKARNAAVTLLEKIASYDISPNYGIITFATNAKEIVSTTDRRSNDADWVIRQLQNLKHQEHLLKPGTNIYKALLAVYTMMTNQQAEELNRGLRPAPVANSTRHVIILLTDAEHNMGGKPAPVIGQISEFLSIGHDPENPREDYLDVYVFGIGAMVNMENVNELASRKPNEQHSFKLRDYEDLREAFDKMIDEADTLSMCGLAKQHSSAYDFEKYPWHSVITIRRVGKRLGFEQCKGSLVSEYFVLTAAHCFTIDDKADEITVSVGGEKYQVAQVISHPEYTIGKLRAQGIPEFYDYDVALVKLAKKVKFQPSARPVCLPCTAGTTRALRKPHPQTTCRDHEEELLPVGNIQAFFVGVCRGDGNEPGMSQRTVRIRNGEKKMACEADALKASQYKNATEVSQVVTERFLCTGGADPKVDPNTCKGDSGGPLIIDKRLRYIQVGVISWGVVDVCKRSIPRCDDTIPGERFPSYARDFHINIFKVLPWLRERLSDEGLDFL